MGGCCSGDGDKEGNATTNRNTRPPAAKSYDSDDSSQDPAILPVPDADGSDYENNDDGNGSGNGDETDIDVDDGLLSPRSSGIPQLSSHNSTVAAINRNVVSGWKNAVHSGNDSLVIHLYEEYKEHDVISIVFESGDNSLHVACQQKKLSLAYFLLTKGIEINVQNEKNGNTALHYACEQRDEKLVKLLLKNHADPLIKNRRNKTPFDIAKRYRSHHIQQLLRAAQESQAFSNAFGDENMEIDLDDIDDFGGASDGKKPKRPISRPTELQGKRIGGYRGGLLDEDNDIADSESDGGALNQNNRIDADSIASNKSSVRDRAATSSEANSEFEDETDDEYDQPQTKEEKENQEQALELHKIKQRNPFVKRKLERKKTKKILESGGPEVRRKQSAAADNEILMSKKAKLPELEGWLEKRKPRPPYQWQKRWVIVKDTHILWSDKQRTIEDPSNQAERKDFNGFLNINVLHEVSKYDSKSSNKFIIKARDAKKGQTREYLWKCPSNEDRNYWVRGLRQYMKYHEDVYKFGY